jgi:hypothetical protein
MSANWADNKHQYNSAANVGYTEQRIGERLTVSWVDAVPVYARLVAFYGFILGASFWLILAYGLNESLAKSIYMIVPAGGLGAGLGGLFSVIIKDLVYPYTRPQQFIKQLPKANTPIDAKPMPLVRSFGPGQEKIGIYKLTVEQRLALAVALIEKGERMISKRKLEAWGIVADRNGKDANQIMRDLKTLEYATDRGNSQFEAVDELIDYLSDMFPALHPPTQLAI